MSDPGWFIGNGLQDNADKVWLREEEPLGARLLTLIFRMLVLAVLLAVFLTLIGANEARAQSAKRFWVLLDNSKTAATFDECQRAHPKRGRPVFTISYQQRIKEPHHHRTCVFEAPIIGDMQ